MIDCRSKIQVVSFKKDAQNPSFNPRQQLSNISNGFLPRTGKNFCCGLPPGSSKRERLRSEVKVMGKAASAPVETLLNFWISFPFPVLL